MLSPRQDDRLGPGITTHRGRYAKTALTTKSPCERGGRRKRPEGPTSKADRIRRTGTKRRTRSGKRRVAGGRGGPRRECRPPRATGEGQHKTTPADRLATVSNRKAATRLGAKPEGRDRLSSPKKSGLGSRAPGARHKGARAPLCRLVANVPSERWFMRSQARPDGQDRRENQCHSSNLTDQAWEQI